jgi:hypothetical protein
VFINPALSTESINVARLIFEGLVVPDTKTCAATPGFRV